MIRIEHKNEFLNLPKGVRLSLELNSPIPLGVDNFNTIPGSLVYTIELPADDQNSRNLGYPQLPSVKNRYLEKSPCRVFVKNIHFFDGLLTVTKTSQKEKKIYITIAVGRLTALNDTPLQDMDFGKFHADETADGMSYFCKQKVLNAERSDYTFLPVHNAGLRENREQATLADDEFQNIWQTGPDMGKVVVRGGSILSPQLSTRFLLKRMFENLGYELADMFHTTRETKQLFLYSNTSVYSAEGNVNATWFHLKDAAPSGTAANFLLQFSRLTGFAPFVSLSDSTVRFESLDTIRAKQPRHDWTNRFSDFHETEMLTPNLPKSITYQRGDDLPHPDDKELKKLFLAPNTGGGYKYMSGLGPFGGADHTRRVEIEPIVNVGGKSDDYEIQLTPMVDGRLLRSNWELFAPTIQTKAKFLELETEENKVATPLRLIVHRGFRGVVSSAPVVMYNHPVSCASTHTLDGRPAKVGWDYQNPNFTIPPQLLPVLPKHSFDLKGEKGVFNQFISPMVELAKNARRFKATGFLSFQELRFFNLTDPVVINGNVYMVTQLNTEIGENTDFLACEFSFVELF